MSSLFVYLYANNYKVHLVIKNFFYIMNNYAGILVFVISGVDCIYVAI